MSGKHDAARAVEHWRPELAIKGGIVIKQELSDYGRFFSDLIPLVKEPVEGTLWATDIQTAQANDVTVGALGYADEQIQRVARSIRDHATALQLVFEHNRLMTMPAWTSVRAAMEGILFTCWLTDAEVPSEMRVARAASLLPGTIQGTIETLKKFPATQQEELKDKLRAREEIVTYYAEHGVELHRVIKKDGTQLDDLSHVVFRGKKAAIQHNVSQHAEKYLGSDHFLYAFLSGAAHSKPWFLSGLGTDVYEALNAILKPVFPLSVAYVSTLSNYFGYDPAPFLRRQAFRAQALVVANENYRFETEGITST